MRIKRAIFIAIVAASASWMAAALARNPDARNSDARNSDVQPPAEPSASSSCSALQQTADGTWARLPCQELGSAPQPPRKSAAGSPEQQTR